MTRLRFLIAFASITMAACGGGSSSTTGEETESAETAGGEGEVEPGSHAHASARELIGINPPEQPWSTMSHDDKEMDMIARFLPITKEMFQEYDASRFADFGCESCHGTDMREREFAMPSAQLPAVPAAGTPAYQNMASALPEMTHFMEEQVTPTMGTMLGMGDTFTCNGCHPTPDGN